MHLRIRHKLVLALTAVIVAFIAVVDYIVLDLLNEITDVQIADSIQTSVKAYERFERARRDLFQTRVDAMSAVPHLKATLGIQDVDSETVAVAGDSLRKIADMPVMLVLGDDGAMLANVHGVALEPGQIGSLPGAARVFEHGESVYGAGRLGDGTFRFAIAPVTSAGYLVGAVLIGEPIGTAMDIESLQDLASVDAAVALNGRLTGRAAETLPLDIAGRLAAVSATQRAAAQEPVRILERDHEFFALASPLGDASAVLFFTSRDKFATSLDPVRTAVRLASLLAVLLGALISVRVASRISAPLGQLTDAAKRFGEGQFDQQLVIRSRDEVGTLASAFVTMARAIELNRVELIASKEAAEASSRAKSTFLATMSHEVRTPLNGVIGMATLLQHTALTPRQAHYCQTISGSSRALLASMNEILELSRIESGQQAVNVEFIDLGQSVKDTVGRFERAASIKGLALNCDVRLPVDASASTDGRRIAHVLTNLVNNAIKFTEHGAVDVRVEALPGSGQPVTVRFSVADTGIGIDPTTQVRMFESFEQADGSMSREFGGIGLGLTISKLIVELLGGELELDSKPGSGSRFWFDLPMELQTGQTRETNPFRSAEAAERALQEPDLIMPPRRNRDLGRFEGLTALIAEDNTVNQEVAREALGLLGVTVEIAGNGGEALTMFTTHPPSFVLMDCQMPVVDGFEATRAIRLFEHDGGRRTPIIALTANTMDGDRENCIAAGMDDFIGKPFDLEELRNVLLRFFGDHFTYDGEDAFEPMPEQPENPDCLDVAVLDSLRAIGRARGNDFFVKVVNLYLTDAPPLIVQIGTALADGEHDQVRQCAHALKSNSAAIGAIEVARLSAELEEAAKQQRADQSVSAHDLMSAFERAAAALGPKAGIGAAAPNQAGVPIDTATAERTTDAAAADRRVLVVDDDRTFRLTIIEALRDAGFDVDEASSGAHAERVARHSRPDLVLLDAMMPDVDGFETCRRFKMDPVLADIPVLMVTGLNDRQSVDRAFEFGAAGFVTKPIQHAVLGHQIRFVIRANETARALRDSELQLATAQRIASLGYWIWNVETGEFSASDALSSISEDATVMSLEAFESYVEEEDRVGFRDDINRVIDERAPVESTYRMRASDGHVKYVHQHLSLNSEATDKLVVIATVQDITARRLAEERVRYLAYYDALTGLASRTYLYERINEMIKSARRRGVGFALLFLDLDGFKDVNDTLGHSEGDALLEIVAARLKASLRENDFLARFGGDEFCALLEDASDEFDIGQIAARCLSSLEADVNLRAHTVLPRASIGIARYPQDGEDLNALLRAADSAMYVAKANGKHRFEYFDSAMTVQAEHRFVLAQELRDALAEQQFVLYYQPQISVETGDVEAFEALVRWQHPQRGMVPPNEFIPELERLGLIDDLGEWAIHEACRQTAAWRRDGDWDVRVCVNISATHFQKPDLVSVVQAALDEFDVDPSRLELEVTETALQYTDATIDVLEQLKAKRVGVAIDDFGTGYSSLGSLQHLPVDCLKIDRMFVRDLAASPKDAVLLGTIMTLAHTLEFRVVAEGVEEVEQLDILRGLDCDLVQGFYFSKPLPALEAARYSPPALKAAPDKERPDDRPLH